MELKHAVQVLEKEYATNNNFELDMVSDKLQFLIALTTVEQGMKTGLLKESDYITQVIKVLE